MRIQHVFLPSCFTLLWFDFLLFMHYKQQNIHTISAHMAIVIGYAPLIKPEPLFMLIFTYKMMTIGKEILPCFCPHHYDFSYLDTSLTQIP